MVDVLIVRENIQLRRDDAEAATVRTADGLTNVLVVKTIALLGVGVNSIAGSLFAPTSVLHTQSADLFGAAVQNDAYGGSISAFRGRASPGTPAAPTAVPALFVLGALAGHGHDGVSFGLLGDAAVVIASEEAFTAVAHGTQMQFYTTPLGTVALTARYVMGAGGDFIMFGANALRNTADATGSVGTAVFRWGLVRAVTITAGDLTFENGWRVTEDWKGRGLLFKDSGGEEMMAIRPDGLYVRGRKVA
jgi:hypothetical protein